MSDKTNWEKTIDGTTHYVEVSKDRVIVGSHRDSGATDEAGECSPQQFVNGRFHDVILAAFGEKTLAQILTAVRAISRL